MQIGLLELGCNMNVLYDMETQDPDDLFALCILAHHPQVQLRGVCITPGSLRQVGLIRYALEQMGIKDVPVGAFNPKHSKECISEWWLKFLGHTFYTAESAREGWNLYDLVLAEYPDTTIITGAPLKNLGQFLREYDISCIERWVAQGGFAGDNVVPAEYRLPKFEGKVTCPTFNFNGDPKAAEAALRTTNIKSRYLVSKNVCHGFVYDHQMHERLAPLKDRNPGLRMVYDGMSRYLADKPEGKKFHDPLAVCAAINPGIIEFREVEVYRHRGEWGSRLASGTNTWISIHADADKFFDTMVGKET